MNQIDLKGRVAIITGGAQGFGYAIAKRFLESGSEVIIWDIDKEAIKKIENEFKNKKFSSYVVDITNYEDVKKNIQEISSNKKIDIFINNAGITGINAKVWDYPNEEWHKVVNINFHAVFYCCKAVVPHMIKNNYGRIVNIASISGKEGNANASAYSSAKAGIIGLTKSLGKELADKILQ